MKGIPGLVLQEQPGLSGTHIWLAIGAMILVFSIVAFTFMLVIRRGWVSRLVRHPLLSSMDRWLSTHLPSYWRFIRARFTIGQWHGLALTFGLLTLALGTYVFALITESWTDEEALYLIDQKASTWLMERMTENTTAIMRTFTRFGDSEVVAALSVTTGLYLLYRRYVWHLLTLVLAPGLGSAAVVAFKALFGRTRPASEAAMMLGHSFPSGHAFAAMSFYGLIIYLIWRHVRNDWIRIITTILLVAIIVLVGLSRIMLRVHWVSDVVGGFTLALAWLVCSIVLTYTLRSLFGAKDNRPDARPNA